jgi:hypothetical protein
MQRGLLSIVFMIGRLPGKALPFVAAGANSYADHAMNELFMHDAFNLRSSGRAVIMDHEN